MEIDTANSLSNYTAPGRRRGARAPQGQARFQCRAAWACLGCVSVHKFTGIRTPRNPRGTACVTGTVGLHGPGWLWARRGKPWPDSPGLSVTPGVQGVRASGLDTRPVPVACGRGTAAMTRSLFTVSPPVWELITVRTRRVGWKDEQIAVCLQHVWVCRPHQRLFWGCGA